MQFAWHDGQWFEYQAPGADNRAQSLKPMYPAPLCLAGLLHASERVERPPYVDCGGSRSWCLVQHAAASPASCLRGTSPSWGYHP